MFFNGSNFLPLLVSRIFTDHPHYTVPLNYLAIMADFFHRYSYFHGYLYCNINQLLERYVILPLFKS